MIVAVSPGLMKSGLFRAAGQFCYLEFGTEV